MKMKKALLSVAFLLATSGAMAAMSFTSANVKSDASFTVENSNDALLAVYPGTTTIHNAAYIEGKDDKKGTGKLVIDLDKGFNNKDYGVQNGSTYTWDDLFRVKNNSEHPITVTVKAETSIGKNSLGVEGELANNVTIPKESDLVIENAQPFKTVTFVLGKGEEHIFNLDVITNGVEKSEKKYTLVVDATKN